MMGHLVPAGSRGIRLVAVMLLAVGSVACSQGTDPEERPTQARIRVEGTAPAPLRLVLSTDFFEVADDVTFEVGQVLNRADTLEIQLPFDSTVALTNLGSILVDLANEDPGAAQVRMRVDLDNGEDGYDQSATMSAGGALRYVYVFIQIIV